MKEIKLELPIVDLSGVCESMNELKKAVGEYGKREVIVRLGTALIKSGVKCSAIIEDSDEEVILDFSEHDKKVAEEKDSQMALLENINKAWIGVAERFSVENMELSKKVEILESLIEEEKNKKLDVQKINLNDRVKVKLTPLGVEIYYHQYDELNKITKSNGGTPLEPVMPQIDKDGYTEFTLHHFISLYGKHIGMAKPNVIQPLNIVIV